MYNLRTFLFFIEVQSTYYKIDTYSAVKIIDNKKWVILRLMEMKYFLCIIRKYFLFPFSNKCKKIPGIIFYCSLSFFEEVVNFVSELDYKKRAALTKSK